MVTSYGKESMKKNTLYVIIVLFSLLEFFPFPHGDNLLSNIVMLFHVRIISGIIILCLFTAYLFTKELKMLFVVLLMLSIQFFYGNIIDSCNKLTYRLNKDKEKQIAYFLGTNIYYQDYSAKIEWKSYFDSWNILVYSPEHGNMNDDSDIEQLKVYDENYYVLSKSVFE